MMSIQLTPEALAEDIKQHKIKEGWMAKKSRFLREWRERWIVLTKNYMYSFEHKQVYTKPTEILPICDIETLKSYFKQQQQKEWSFRAENKNVNFYLAGKNNQEKWAWMTAIERAIDRNHNGTEDDKEKVIGKMRETFLAREKQNTLMARPSYMVPPVMKKQLREFKLQKIRIDPIPPLMPTNTIKTVHNQKQYENPNSVNQPNVSSEISTSVAQKAKLFQTASSNFKGDQKIVQKIVEVEKIVYVQKIVQKIIQKIIEVKVPTEPKHQINHNYINSLTKAQVIGSLFSEILSVPINFNFLVKFLITLSNQQKLDYSSAIIQACLTHPNGRYFSEALLYLYNQQTDEEYLNLIIKFILQVYEKADEYFYITDLKVLLDIICRQLELYRSDVNHYLMLELIKSLCLKEGWQKLQDYRLQDIKNLVGQINGITSSSVNKSLTKELLQYL